MPDSSSQYQPGFEPDGIVQRAIEAYVQSLRLDREMLEVVKQAQDGSLPSLPPEHWTDIRRSTSGPFTMKES